MNTELELGETLDRIVPEPAIRLEWEAVLRDAARPRRRRRAGAAALALAVAAVAAAVLLWPGRSGEGGVLERALAAVGNGPVIHVVFRDDAHVELVDLATGATRSIAYEHEQWYDPARGLKEIERFDGRVTARRFSPPGRVSQHQRQELSGILDGYRDALRSGDARLVGPGVVDGRPVYWIHFRGERLPDVADGKLHEWAQEVAIDRTTYGAVATRETRDGEPGPDTGETILRLEATGGEGVDFSPPAPERPQAFVTGTEQSRTIAPDGAAEALGRTPAWLGASWRGRPLVRVQAETAVSGSAGRPDRFPALELCYGSLGGGACDGDRSLLVREATGPTDLFDWPLGPAAVTIPPGSALVGWGGRYVCLVRDGVYVTVSAPSREEALAAARALVPLTR